MIDYNLTVKLLPLHSVSPHVILEWRNHYKIRRWCRQYDLIPIGAHQEWYKRQVEGSPTEKMYAIEGPEQMPEKIIGVCGLTSLDLINRRAEFSIYIAPAHQSQGFGRAALKILVSHGFNSFGLESIWGESFRGNPAQKMFKKLGFKEDGCRRNFYFREGHFIDAYLYSITRKDWLSAKAFERAREEKCFI